MEHQGEMPSQKKKLEIQPDSEWDMVCISLIRVIILQGGVYGRQEAEAPGPVQIRGTKFQVLLFPRKVVSTFLQTVRHFSRSRCVCQWFDR